jgi:hypothetical protein
MRRVDGEAARRWQSDGVPAPATAPMGGDDDDEILQHEGAIGSEEGSTMVDNDGWRGGSPCRGRSGGSGGQEATRGGG